jgi:AP-4 complex subunit epsilon-1
VDLNVQQRCLEFHALLSHASLMQAVLPVDASCEDLGESGDLPFLDAFVAHALADGAQPYAPPSDRGGPASPTAAAHAAGLKYDAYAAPAPAPPPAASAAALDLGGASGAASSGGQLGAKKANALGGRALGAAAGPWGAPHPPAAPAPAAPAPAAAAAATTAAAAQEKSDEEFARQLQAQETAAAAEPAKPRELSEREKQAAMLFGGLDGGSSSETGRRAGARRLPPKPSVAAVPSAAVAVPSVALPVDLLNLDAPPAPPDRSSPVADLFGFADLTLAPPAAGMASSPTAAPGPAVSVDPFAASAPAVAAMVWQGSAVTPLGLTTPAFGGKWTSMAASEKRANANLPGAPRLEEASPFGLLILCVFAWPRLSFFLFVRCGSVCAVGF